MSPHRWFLSAQSAKTGKAFISFKDKTLREMCAPHLVPIILFTLTRMVKKSRGLENKFTKSS